MAFGEVKKIGHWANPFHSTSKTWFGSLDIAPENNLKFSPNNPQFNPLEKK